MKKLVFRVLLLIAVILCLLEYLPETRSREILPLEVPFGKHNYNSQRIFNGMIRIETEDSVCSAFVIDDNYAITAAHCLVNKGRLTKQPIFIPPYFKAEAVGYER